MCPVTSSAAAYADENALAMVFDFEAVKVTVVTVVYDDDEAATSEEERASQEVTVVTTSGNLFIIDQSTVVTLGFVEAKKVTVNNPTVVSSVCWCSGVR